MWVYGRSVPDTDADDRDEDSDDEDGDVRKCVFVSSNFTLFCSCTGVKVNSELQVRLHMTHIMLS